MSAGVTSTTSHCRASHPSLSELVLGSGFIPEGMITWLNFFPYINILSS